MRGMDEFGNCNRATVSSPMLETVIKKWKIVI